MPPYAVTYSQTESFWSSTELGSLHLPHRLAMAPMTRNRSAPDGTPVALNAEYYAQRASTSLIITEGTQPSADGQGYLLTPGIYKEAHVEGWRRVADAVHDAGGKIIVQLMHVGRVAHPNNTPHGRQPLAPSAIKPDAQMFTAEGMKDIPEPRALSTAEVEQTVQDFRHAAACAIDAGLDGVEIHGANGYLVQQFLSSNANQRTDRYGGSVENRIRFAVEVAEAIADEIGPERTGIHLSPGNSFNDIAEEDVVVLYKALVESLAELDLAYIHPVYTEAYDELFRDLRRAWPNAYILNRPDADLSRRARDIESGLADVVSVGRMTLANPDLVERIKADAPLNDPDPDTFYGGDAHGYTDYPTLPETRRAVPEAEPAA